ncbi:ornithine cyclodeaminase family protein [Lentzea sp. NPDC058450]|uniref:ornithine cyclodeaminase family protein n=1 Tax=Lentzea sp. NPDC058450 TaxID=3346505 RepID=UPI003650B451
MLLLGAGDLRIDLPRLAAELTEALRAGAEPGQRVRAAVTPDVTAMVLMPGLSPGIPAYTVKVHAKNPARSPAITGVICLHDLSGDLLAIIDSPRLTAVRTGLGGALGAHLLARPEARTVTVIGAGVQGRAQLEALTALRPVESVCVRDVDPVAERDFLAWAAGLGVPAGPEGEIVLMATWSRVPVLHEVPPGTHVTSLGADEPGKAELGADLLASALVVVDDPALAHVAAGTTIGAVLRGEHPGRTSAEEVTVYSPAGLPMQDLVIAWHVYRNALS